MVQYLIDENILIGKTKKEVSHLLGETSNKGVGMMLYNLGSERGSLFAVDDDWLEITFEGTPDHSNVKSARIRPD